MRSRDWRTAEWRIGSTALCSDLNQLARGFQLQTEPFLLQQLVGANQGVAVEVGHEIVEHVEQVGPRLEVCQPVDEDALRGWVGRPRLRLDGPSPHV